VLQLLLDKVSCRHLAAWQPGPGPAILRLSTLCGRIYLQDSFCPCVWLLLLVVARQWNDVKCCRAATATASACTHLRSTPVAAGLYVHVLRLSCVAVGFCFS
jgi:hypothetical protein